MIDRFLREAKAARCWRRCSRAASSARRWAAEGPCHRSSWAEAAARWSSQRDLVQRRVLRAQVGDEVFVGEALAGDLLDQVLGEVAKAFAVNLRAQPVAQREQLSLAQLLVEAGEIFLRGHEQRRRIEVAERVGREVAELAP